MFSIQIDPSLVATFFIVHLRKGLSLRWCKHLVLTCLGWTVPLSRSLVTLYIPAAATLQNPFKPQKSLAFFVAALNFLKETERIFNSGPAKRIDSAAF